MKKTLALLAVALVMVSMIASTKAEVVLDNSTYTILNNADESCFANSPEGLINYNMEIQPDSKCIGVAFTSPPQYCQREIRLRNPTNGAFPIAVQVIPIPDGLPCPAPSYTNNKATVRFLPSGSSTRSQHNQLDLNECWNWWCNNVTYNTELRCPYGWDALQYLGFLGGCYNVNVTIGNPMDKCPIAIFTAQGDDNFVDIKMDWVKSPANDVDVPYILKIKGYVTDYQSTMGSTYEETTLSEGVVNYVTGLETLTTVNVNLLQIIFMIFEIASITFAIIGIPAFMIMLIKWVWEAVTGRPFGWKAGRKQ
jgi:hypothetical protein